MKKLILLCDRPRSSSRDESVAWLRRATAKLADGSYVAALRLTELESASLRYARCYDWMVEAQLSDGVDAQHLVESAPWRELLGDLRLLGMRPSIAVADAARTSTLGPGA